jgi:hypothetical protein
MSHLRLLVTIHMHTLIATMRLHRIIHTVSLHIATQHLPDIAMIMRARQFLIHLYLLELDRALPTPFHRQLNIHLSLVH